MYSELSKVITDLVKQGFPEIESVFRYDLLATVISTDRDRGVATVHPMRPDGAKDDMTDDIPDVPLPVFPSPAGAAYCVPDDGELVRMAYYYHDPSQPKIVECLGKGHIYGDLLWVNKDGTSIEIRGADSHIIAQDNATTSAPHIGYIGDDITLTGDAISVGKGSGRVDIG